MRRTGEKSRGEKRKRRAGRGTGGVVRSVGKVRVREGRG